MTQRKQDDLEKTLSHNVVHLDLAGIELTTSMMRICE